MNSPVSLPHSIGLVRSSVAVSIVLVVSSNFSSTASNSKTPLSWMSCLVESQPGALPPMSTTFRSNPRAWNSGLSCPSGFLVKAELVDRVKSSTDKPKRCSPVTL